MILTGLSIKEKNYAWFIWNTWKDVWKLRFAENSEKVGTENEQGINENAWSDYNLPAVLYKFFSISLLTHNYCL